MPNLLVISSMPADIGHDGRLRLDTKFVEGMRLYSRLWPGKVGCVLTRLAEQLPFSREYDASDLPFLVKLIEFDSPISAEMLCEFDVVLCSGDSHRCLHLAELCQAVSVHLFYAIENTPRTRCQIIFLDERTSLLQKIHSSLWTLFHEYRRRKAFALADGLQANGYPAMRAYGTLNHNTLLYIDNRMGQRLLATAEEMKLRRDRLVDGFPLRLIHSGRLEPLKGVQDLVPIAAQLRRTGVEFELNIFGTGSLEQKIRDDVRRQDLEAHVFLHGAVDFETELVPFARANADIFLSCHRQSDPSCTYVESMGCGLAIAGYANQMWKTLCERSGGGWVVPLGNAQALARLLEKIAHDRQLLANYCSNSHIFASNHTFEREFELRVAHLSKAPMGYK